MLQFQILRIVWEVSQMGMILQTKSDQNPALFIFRVILDSDMQIDIPGSSKYVTFLPFWSVFRVKSHKYLEDPGIRVSKKAPMQSKSWYFLLEPTQDFIRNAKKTPWKWRSGTDDEHHPKGKSSSNPTFIFWGLTCDPLVNTKIAMENIQKKILAKYHQHINMRWVFQPPMLVYRRVCSPKLA